MLKIVTQLLSALALLVLVGLSLRGIIDPLGAALAFGVPATAPDSEFYHAVYRQRNLVLASAGLAFLGFSMWRALAILTTASIALPVYDIWALGVSNLPIGPVHWVTLTMLVLLTALMWMQVVQQGNAGGVEGKSDQRRQSA